jgi:DNA-binding transcriptional LysR family regulator
MELRHARYFIAVAEELNFRRAARRLHVAQPPLSSQIKALESELGVRLFERTTRQVKLTAAGNVFLEECRLVLEAAGRAERRAREAQHGVAGTLRLGIIAPVANAWLARILREFRQNFPLVQLSLFDLTSTEQLQRLEANELDAGLLRPPIVSPELQFDFVNESEHVLAAPAGHPLAVKKKLTWKDFDDQELVLIHPRFQHEYYNAFLQECTKAGARPRATQFANDIHTKMWLISAGFGIAPTTATIAEVQRPGLVFRELPPGLPTVKTVLVWKKENSSIVLQRFRAALKSSAL